MPDNIKQIPEKIKEFFQAMNKRVRIILIVAAAVIIGAVGLIIYHNSTMPYEVLFSGLSSSDLTSVVNYLSSSGISDYKIQNSDTVLVRENMADSLKAQLILAGYPESSYTYSLYLDNADILSSDSDRQRLAVYDLQERLASIIENIDNVYSASVSISLEQDNRYILDYDDNVEATASVFVEMKDNKTLTAGQVTAIKNIVSHAVSGLTIDNVTIDDAAGNEYSGDGDLTAITDESTLKWALQAKVNNQVRTSILNVLIPIFGSDNVSVGVSSVVDVNTTYEESVVYSSEDDGTYGDNLGIHGLIGQYIWDTTSYDDGDTTVGGVVGTTTNADLNEYVVDEGDDDAGTSETVKSGSIVYENDKTTTQRQYSGGIITDVTVAVTVNSNVTELRDPDVLVNHVAKAAGISSDIQDEKISVVFLPFYDASANVSGTESGSDSLPLTIASTLPDFVIFGFVAGIILFIVLLIAIFFVNRAIKKRRRKMQEERAAREEALALEKQIADEQAIASALAEAGKASKEGADIMDIHTEKTMELRREVRQFAENNPEIAAQMIKSWLKGDEENA